MASFPSRILITGATGYLGAAAAEALEREGVPVVRGARNVPAGATAPWAAYGELEGEGDVSGAVSGCGAVIHFAGLAHVKPGPGADEKARAVNVLGTRRLAEAAARVGVERFVYVSSAQVHGASSADGPFREDSPIRPADIYAASKAEAEAAVRDVCAKSGMAFVILRPPMVYGPESPGNFHRLVSLVRRGWPSPFGAATAPKSFIGVDNLCSAVTRAVLAPEAANETFLLCDAETTSTAGLIAGISTALGRKARNVPVPAGALRMAGRWTGRGRDIERLFDPFEIDASHIRRTLGWTARVTLAEGLARAIRHEQAEPRHQA